jgi:Spx/MgsR family transcriptional regulator
MYTLYGIPNCDTVKKARVYLDKRHLPVSFVDFKKSPPQKVDIERWADAFGGMPVNVKGSTYKKHQTQYEKLSPGEQIKFLIANSSMLKRPILEKNGKVVSFGYDEEVFSKLS